MLGSIPAWKWEEIKLFEILEPDEGERNDWGLAHIVQALVRNGKQLKEFLLPFGDTVTTMSAPQPVSYQERLIDTWIVISNAIFKAQEEARAK